VLDRDTVIRSPHAATRTCVDGRTETRIDDPRVSVSMQEDGATLTLFFDPDMAWTGEAPLAEIRLSPPATGEFAPWRLMPRLPLNLQYARASLAYDRGDAVAALRALREIGSTRRGLGDEFLRAVADAYRSVIAAGQPHPVKALAMMAPADISTASRWISAARARGLLDDADERRGEQP
jgi:hypothetical protein